MRRSHYVARTAPGHSHLNTLVVPTTKAVVVFLDGPHLPFDVEDRFRLVSHDGKYDRVLRRSEAARQGEQRVALHFIDVPPVGTYSLYHGVTSDIEMPIFQDVPFADLTNSGEEATASSPEDVEKLVLHPPPKLGLDDPLLHAHPADYSLDAARYPDPLAYRSPKPTDSSGQA